MAEPVGSNHSSINTSHPAASVLGASRGDAFRSRRRLGALILVVLATMATAYPLLSHYRYDEVNLASIKQRPGWLHWMGTDELGRDVAVRVMTGARLSLAIGLGGALLACAVGAWLGASSGYFGGWIDGVTMRCVDLQLSIPTLPVLIVVSAFSRPGVPSLIVLLSLFAWMEPARLARAEALRIRELAFTEAGRAAGASGLGIVWRHVIPNARGPLVVAAALLVGRMIVMESVLSFLGLGVQPPLPSLGSLLYGAQNALATEPWLALFPGACICLFVLGINLLGEGLGAERR